MPDLISGCTPTCYRADSADVRRLSLLLALLALLPLAARSAPSRAEVAARWAPSIYQETHDPRDFITSYDFDGDWDLSNNAAHVAEAPLPAVVYYTVAETATHWLITYLPYHPVDAKSPSGHDHDSEHISLVVRKDGALGRAEAMETRFHHVLYQYAVPTSGIRDAADDIDGPIHFDVDERPMVNSQRVGHGLCGGYAPPARFWDWLALTCLHHKLPQIDHQGVVYRFRGRANVPRSLDDRDVGYALVELGDSLWPRAQAAAPNAVFATLFDFRGARCSLFHCPQKIGGLLLGAPGHSSTHATWAESSGRGVEERGEAFFDPAYTFSKRLRIPAPFSLDYLFNPYLGVGKF